VVELGPLEARLEEAGIEAGEARDLVKLVSELLEKRALPYQAVVSSSGEDAVLTALELGLVVPERPDSRCLEWDSCPIGPGTALELNPAAGAAIRALLEGRRALEGLEELFSELGLRGRRASALAELSLELAARRTVSGSHIASSCRSRGLEGLESTVIAILKAAGVISPVLSSSWPSGDVRYRTCRFLALLAP